MAQQTTQFAPGGNLTNWTPGFSTSGSPIRGLKVDNTSGSWLSIIVPSLPVQYIAPYTLAWSMTLLTPLSNITINSGGPPNSISTLAGTNVTVYAYTDSVGDSAGSQYYTPNAEPIRKLFFAQINFDQQAVPFGAGPVPVVIFPINSGRTIRIYGYGLAYQLYFPPGIGTAGGDYQALLSIQLSAIGVPAQYNVGLPIQISGAQPAYWIDPIITVPMNTGIQLNGYTPFFLGPGAACPAAIFSLSYAEI